jgi:hypothetical protein
VIGHIDPVVQDTTINLYAGEIKKAANGRGRSIGRQARRKTKIQLEGGVKRNGEIHVSQAAGGFCENKTTKTSNQKSVTASSLLPHKYNHSRE